MCSMWGRRRRRNGSFGLELQSSKAFLGGGLPKALGCNAVGVGDDQRRRDALRDIFILKLCTMLEWLLNLTEVRDEQTWECAQNIAHDLWTLGCAATATRSWL